MKEEIFFKETIRQFNSKSNYTTLEEIIYKIENINNIYFYAKEISTGAIFPIYNFANIENKLYNGGIIFRTQSNTMYGKNFVFCPLSPCDNPFYFYVNKEGFEKLIPSIDEINKYIKEKKNDKKWKKKIRELEEENKYYCDLSLIKNILGNEQNKELESIKNLDNLYEEAEGRIDISEIAEFGYDLSTRNDLCHLIGREEEKKKIIKSTCLGENSIILIGASGAGKTVIVENLALEIKQKSNTWLNNKTIFYVNTSALVVDTRYSGEFEKKIQTLIDFCIKNRGKIILFIDEIHMLYGLGRTKDSSLDAMNILKPYIESGDIIIIGATTKLEFNEYLATDPAFVRRLEKLELEPPTREINIDILLSYIELLEKKYNIKFSEEENKLQIITHIIDITDKKNQRVIGDIQIENPTIAKRLLKEAFTEARYNRKDKVTLEEICYAIKACDKFSPTFKEIAIQEITKDKETKTKVQSNLILMRKK